MHLLCELLTKWQFWEIDLNEVIKDVGLDGQCLLLEEFKGLVVLVMVLDHFFRKGFSFKTFDLLSVVVLVIDRGKELLDDLLLLFLHIVGDLYFIVFSLLLTVTAELNQLVVVKTNHQEDRIQLLFHDIDPLISRPQDEGLLEDKL